MENNAAVAVLNRRSRACGFTAAGFQTGSRFAGLDEFHAFLATGLRGAQARLVQACRRRPAACPRCRDCDCAHGRWLGKRRIPAKAWLAAVKSFELGLGGRQTARLTGLSKPTVYATLDTIRAALAALDPDWSAPSGDEKSPVFGVRWEGERVRVTRVHGPAAGCDAVISYGAALPRRTADPFLRYLAAQTAKHFGIPQASFPLYLKEYEFRFNRRGRPLFDEILDALTRPA